MAEQISWTKPGRVSSVERAPPPTVSLASSTRTDSLAWARRIAAASPFGPAPTTTASYDTFSAINADTYSAAILPVRNRRRIRQFDAFQSTRSVIPCGYADKLESGHGKVAKIRFAAHSAWCYEKRVYPGGSRGEAGSPGHPGLEAQDSVRPKILKTQRALWWRTARPRSHRSGFAGTSWRAR